MSCNAATRHGALHRNADPGHLRNMSGLTNAIAALAALCAVWAGPISAQDSNVGAPTSAPVWQAHPELGGLRPVARTAPLDRMDAGPRTEVRPVARDPFLPEARWDHLRRGPLWTRAAMAALEANAPRLTSVVPRDIATWCPAYPQNPPELRRAFWAGMMSALAHYESTHRPQAVGGRDQWFGLMQIYPPTARGYGCRARSGTALTDPEDNLSCAARIMNRTVPRDRAVALHDGRWRGVAADWGPMTNRTKREAMAEWTRSQTYCRPNPAPLRAIRPLERPVALTATISTASAPGAEQRPVARPE